MNNLSWLIYLGDVGRIGATSVILTIICFIASVVLLVYKLDNKCGWGLPCIPLVFFTFFLLVGILTPRKQAIYLIAGSQASEAIITSESGKEILKDISEILKQQLKSNLK